MSDRESKRVILARRARFVAAALASAGIVAGAVACGDTESDGGGGTGGVATGGSGGALGPRKTGVVAGGGPLRKRPNPVLLTNLPRRPRTHLSIWVWRRLITKKKQ